MRRRDDCLRFGQKPRKEERKNNENGLNSGVHIREVSEKFPHSVEKKCQRTAVAGIGDPGRQPPFSKTGINNAGYNFKRRYPLYWLFAATCGARLVASLCALTF